MPAERELEPAVSTSRRLVGARPSGRFSVSKPTILELSESWGTADIEAPQTARSVTDNMWMH
jgi:hypothetical protein